LIEEVAAKDDKSARARWSIDRAPSGDDAVQAKQGMSAVAGGRGLSLIDTHRPASTIEQPGKLGTLGSREALIDLVYGFCREAGTMGKLSGVELKRARLVPSSVFASPDEVVTSSQLSRAQKIAILRRWEFDSRGAESRLIVTHGPLLDQVRQALAALGVAPPGHPPAALTRH
jgi:hypothetical protein